MKIWFKISLLLFFLASHAEGQQIMAEWNFPNNPDNNVADINNIYNNGKLLTTNATGAVQYNLPGLVSNCAAQTGWNNGFNVKYWMVDLISTSCYNNDLTFVLRSDPNGPRDFRIEYTYGAGTTWYPLPGGNAITVADDFTTGYVVSLPLPITCDNRAMLRFRWIMNSNISVSGGTVTAGGICYIDEVSIHSNFIGHYRSKASGLWSQTSTWESSTDSITWNNSSYIPNQYSKSVVVRNGHYINVVANLTVQNVTINYGGTVSNDGNYMRLLNNTGCDLNLNGTFIENGSYALKFDTLATWQMGSNGTFIKQSNITVVNWQLNYYNGIQNIPSSGNWIIRRLVASNYPPLTTSTGSVTGAVYPNLFIENYVPGLWDIALNPSTSFNGNGGYPTIKGNFDIGGNGTSTVNFYNAQFNVNPSLVLGNLIVRAGNSLQNEGTGMEVRGDVISNGDIFFNSGATPIFIFGGSSTQTVTGNGKVNLYNLKINKPVNNAILNKPVFVNHNLYLTSGQIETSGSSLLTLDTASLAIQAIQNSFVSGPMRKLGAAAFTFPIGKNNLFRSFGVNAGGSRNTFWTETFNNGCATGCKADVYTGANGTWTETNLSTPGNYANQFYVSCAENGNAVGACGTTCAGNASLHVGVFSTPACPSGDCGAVYFWGNATTKDATTNKRIESPIINCTGKRSIQVSFKYFEGGSTTNDDAIFWYYDGSLWTQISNLAKTPTTCGTGKGLWTAYSASLPLSANNNPNVRIGFVWKNNNDAAGSSTSFAVDDIQLTEPLSIIAEYFNNDPQSTFGATFEPTIDNTSLCDYWFYNVEAGAANKITTLGYDNSTCFITNLPSNMRVLKFDTLNNANIWRDLGNGGNTISGSQGTVASAISNSINSPFTIGYIMDPLPVELLNFNALFENNQVRINWSTAAEPGADFFVVEKSKTSEGFSAIAVVPSKGTNNSGFDYTIYDAHPFAGVNYYRLKQVDKSGDENYSKTVSVNFNDDLIKVFTNESSNELIIQSSQSLKATIEIIDVIGKLVYKQNLNFTTKNSIDLNAFSIGIYHLKITSDVLNYNTDFLVK